MISRHANQTQCNSIQEYVFNDVLWKYGYNSAYGFKLTSISNKLKPFSHLKKIDNEISRMTRTIYHKKWTLI